MTTSIVRAPDTRKAPRLAASAFSILNDGRMQQNRRILAILWLPFGHPRVRVPRDRVRLAQLDFWETTDESHSFRLGTAGVPPIRLHSGNLLSLAGSTQRPNQGPRVGRV